MYEDMVFVVPVLVFTSWIFAILLWYDVIVRPYNQELDAKDVVNLIIAGGCVVLAAVVTWLVAGYKAVLVAFGFVAGATLLYWGLYAVVKFLLLRRKQRG